MDADTKNIINRQSLGAVKTSRRFVASSNGDTLKNTSPVKILSNPTKWKISQIGSELLWCLLYEKCFSNENDIFLLDSAVGNENEQGNAVISPNIIIVVIRTILQNTTNHHGWIFSYTCCWLDCRFWLIISMGKIRNRKTLIKKKLLF